MATEKDLELLDDYIANRMNAEQRSAFEQRIQADPDLKNELSFQSQLVEGIKSARVTELKAMLNNVVVPPANPTISLGTKIAAGTFVAAAVVLGVYLYNNNDDAASSEARKAPIEAPQSESAPEEAQPENTTSPQEEAVKDEEQTIAERRKEANPTPVTPSPVEQPKIEVFDPTEEEQAASEGDESARTSSSAPVSTLAVELERNNRSYAFHYQFKEGKLFLYGPFEKNLYEILEFFDDQKRTVFLFYKNSYYLLNEADEKVKPLTPINDAALISKLKEYRKK